MVMDKLEENNSNHDRSGLKKPLIPYRYFVMFMVLIAATVILAVRCTINVAMIAMVGKSKDNNLTGTINEKHFDWNQREQGTILGSYYYTYATIQIFAGLLADKFNVVHLLALSQVIATLCTFAIPVAASYSIYHLVAVRMTMGLVHGVTWPCLYNLIENWFPPTEVGLAQGLAAAGSDFGTALTSVFAAWISTRGIWGGWPAAFYFMGIINLVFGLIWATMITRDPFSNRFVSDHEKQQLSLIVTNKKVKQPKIATPWIKILTSLPLWSVIITKGTIGLAYSVINSKIPVYLDSVLGYKLENNGLINALFYIAVGSSQLVCGPLSKYIITKGWIGKTITRKLFETIALSGIIASLITVCYLGDNARLIVVCLVLSMFFYGFNLGGDVPIVPEMAPHLVGTAFGFANTLACASGFIAPALIGAILGDEAGSQAKWILAFQIVAGLQFVALILFGTFATAEPQSWGKIKDPNEKDEPSVWIQKIENN